MVRKRKGIPTRLDAVKQQHLAWSMSDLSAESLAVIPDNDPSLQQEAVNANCASTSFSGASVPLQKETGVEEHKRMLAHINQSDFCVHVRRKVPFKETEWHCVLGTFHLEIQTPNAGSHARLPETLPDMDFWFYTSSDPDKQLIYFECDDLDIDSDGMIEVDGKRVMYFLASVHVSWEFLEGLKWKGFPLELSTYNAETARLEMKVLGTEVVLMQLQFSSEGVRSKRVNTSIQHIMAELHNFHHQDYSGKAVRAKPDVAEFYAAIKARHGAELLHTEVNVQHPNLRPRLRKYQKDAVIWMLHRERFGINVKPPPDELHCLYEELYTEDGQLLYYNKHGGYLVKKRPVAVLPPAGGILADEMGLGKTVEVLAAMMVHPRTDLPMVEELPVIKSISLYSSDDEECDKDCLLDGGKPVLHTSTDLACGQQTTMDAPDGVLKLEPVENGKNSPAVEGESKGSDQAVKPDEGITRNVLLSDAVLVQVDHPYCQHPIGGVIAQKVMEEPEVQKSEDIPLSECSAIAELSETGTKRKKGQCRRRPKTISHSNVQPLEDDKSGFDLTQQTSDVISQGNKLIVLEEAASDQSLSNSCSTPIPDVSEGEWTTPKKLPKTKRKPRERRKQVGYVMVIEEEQTSEGFFDESPVKPKEVFECVCGLNSSIEAEADEKRRVQCLECGLWQHPECVKYDLTDPYRGPYLCPHCHVVTTPVPSGATLIISPNSICHQWEDEIRKHIHQERLKVLVYKGVHVHGFLQPQHLARHDIVIISYETLQKEINYIDLPHSNSQAGRRFRHPKRFMAVPSPIIAVEWWRICLDEAQMVECTTTKSAEMALRLSAVNRWCVTGTPIQKGLDDLYGLLLFLGEDPYWVHTWWTRLLYRPYCFGNKLLMHDAMAKVMWRTCKDDVIDQICLPTQGEQVHWLSFSPIEEHFYKRTFSQCARVGLNSLSKWQDASTKLNSVDRYTLHALLGPLTKIRQACCHPQAVRGSFLPLQKSTMTMEELLVSMTRKARLECEEAHRQLNAAVNGLAGLHIIKQEYVEAVELYRDVLRSVAEHSGEFRTDPLQHLHTLHNLGEVLSQRLAGIAPTLRDDKLAEEAKELRHKYLQKAASFVHQAEEGWAPLRTSMRELRIALAGGEDWWADLLQWVVYIGQDELLVERVKADLVDNRNPGTISLATSFRDVRGLEYVMANELESLDSAHESLIDMLHGLQGDPTQSVINQTVECCLRPADKPLKTCPFCKANELFDVYENHLFSFKDKGVSEVSGLEGESIFQVGTRRQGTWADSETERILKCLISFVKGFGGTPKQTGGKKLTEVGNTHLKLLDALKKEFKVIRTLWIELHAQVSAHDELDMATTRLRLRLPDEPIPDHPQPNILEPAELDSQRLKVQSDRIINENLLRKKMGQLMYLKNLAKSQTDIAGGENPEPCPVCQRTLSKKWAVLTCGHCYCLDCLRVLVTQCSIGGQNARIKCPMCRQGTRYADINYVSTVQGQSQHETPIKGDHSTKVEGVMQCVLGILRAEPTTKILIFTTWQNVLSIIAQALSDNDVSYVSLLANNKFQRNLSSFKTLDDVNVLLLPVHSGANGLNLVEATHVLLVEPILNHSQELQAIGRVHRIGQTRPTFVHRFLVLGTIEERMHHLLAVRATPPTATSNNADDTPFTVGDLKALYLESQLHDPDMDDDVETEGTIPVSDNTTPREIGPEDTTPVEMEPENTTPGDIGPDNTIPEDMGPEHTPPEDMGCEDMPHRPEDMGPEDTIPEDMGAEDTISEDMGAKDTTPEDIVPEDMPHRSEDAILGEMEPEDTTCGDMGSDYIMPVLENTTQGEMGPEDTTPGEIGDEDTTSKSGFTKSAPTH